MSDPDRTDRIEVVSVDDGEVILYWNIMPSRPPSCSSCSGPTSPASRPRSSSTSGSTPTRRTSERRCPRAKRSSSRACSRPQSPTSACSPRSRASRGSGSSRRSARPRLRERGAPDRQRPDDLAAARRGPHARGARARAEGPRARRWHRLGLPRRAALPARRPRLHDRAPSRAERTRRARARDLGIDNVTFLVGDGWEGLPEQAPFDAINVAAATGAIPPQRSRTSSPTAAGWSPRSGPGSSTWCSAGGRRPANPPAARGRAVRPARPRHLRLASRSAPGPAPNPGDRA